ncbi:MAG: hypothetical protein QUS14_02125, partial [Pyrinomonadaceae bacterium]|nr:hypothetical protein [Pyrinomonadaceae bacterium]
KQIWMSIFTPQIGANDEEILSPELRNALIDELLVLKKRFPKFIFPHSVAEGYRNPPASPDECIFSQTTLNLTADLKTRIAPCQFGGTPDCSQCGCMASAGLAAVGSYKLFNIVPLRKVYDVSSKVGAAVAGR